MMGDTVAEIVTREVMGKVGDEVSAVRVRAEQVLAEVTGRMEAEARARMDDVIANLPPLPVLEDLPVFGEVEPEGFFDPVDWFKSQAKSRAWRTLLQGLLAVVVVAVGNVVVQAFAQGSLNVFSWDDWKVVAALAGSAALTALISYAQNKLGIKPPRA